MTFSYCITCEENFCEKTDKKHIDNKHSVIRHKDLRNKNQVRNIHTNLTDAKEFIMKVGEKKNELIKQLENTINELNELQKTLNNNANELSIINGKIIANITSIDNLLKMKQEKIDSLQGIEETCKYCGSKIDINKMLGAV